MVPHGAHAPLDEEPSSALLAVASLNVSPSISARQPRSAQSCCVTVPAATRRVEVVVLAVISILLFALSFRMFTGLFRRHTYCAAANGTRLSANRPAHGMNSMSSKWGTSGGPPLSSGSGRPPPEQDDGPTMAARYGLNAGPTPTSPIPAEFVAAPLPQIGRIKIDSELAQLGSAADQGR